MAIVRTAGTEIIRTAWFEDINNSSNVTLIVGEQHHIYTVLSITVALSTASSTTSENRLYTKFYGFDAYTGTSYEEMSIFATPEMLLHETFVWNDKFSFNGFEPNWSGGSGGMTTAAEQNLIADQGGSVAQKIECWAGGSTTKMDVSITYIDQNNA
jgi:hypothetical protein